MHRRFYQHKNYLLRECFVYSMYYVVEHEKLWCQVVHSETSLNKTQSPYMHDTMGTSLSSLYI